jgi:protein-S-isoprenylcysteine O-methyltransferase Ste14
MANDASVKKEPARKAAWWRGSRGEWYVILQVCLLLLVAIGPRSVHGLPKWPHGCILVSLIAGCLLVIGGVSLSLAGVLRLGPNLTPLPYPKDESTLVQNGPYGIVRHPIYAGFVLAGFGWGLIVHGWLTLLYSVILFAFFDVKSRKEELWLKEKFRDYPQFQKRVRKLVPWIY